MKELFDHIRESLPKHVSLADTMAELLDLSSDSVYRRIRGEKPISLEEVKILCEHYHISLDQVLNINSDAVVFNASDLKDKITNIEQYLNGVLKQMKYFNSFDNREMLYLCKDAPVFYFYLFPEIASFKTFCWLKTILSHPDYHHTIFSLKEFPFIKAYEIGQQILAEYNKLPGTELWISESLNSTINQIQYYHEARLFRDKKDFEIVLDSLDRMLDHMQQQAERGFKFVPGTTEVGNKAPLKLYINEVLIGNNTVLAELDGNRMTIITYNALSYLMTRDARFCNISFQNFHTLVSKSTLISGTGEKDRNKFFELLRDKVGMLRKL